MCLSMPGHVLAVDGPVARVEVDGRQRNASLLLHPDVQVGDWVFVAAGTVVERLTASDAAFIVRELDRASSEPSREEAGQ